MITSREASPDVRTVLSQGALRRVLGLRDLTLLIIGTVIGSGIFLVPGPVLKAVGNSVPLALSVWTAGGVLSLVGALTFGELSAANPEAGGLYIYIRDSFGRLPAFLFGWILFFVVSTGSVATLAVAFSNYLGELLPLAPWAAKMVSVAMIAILALVNIAGTRQSADMQNLTTIVKVTAILSMAAALLWFGLHSPPRPEPIEAAASSPQFSSFGLAIVSVLWAYEGWQYATFSAGETRNPRRDFPLAFLIGISALVGLYLLVNLGYLAVLGAWGVSTSNRVAAQALSSINPALAKALTLAILVSIFSAANSILMTGPRVYYAMAKDGLFFRRLAEIHSRFGTPAFAIAAGAIWASVLAVSGTFEELLTYVVFVGWMFYGLAAASIFVYRKRKTDRAPGYRVPGFPLTPAVFIASIAAFVVDTIVAEPARAAIGVGVVLTGVPAYAIWRRQ